MGVVVGCAVGGTAAVAAAVVGGLMAKGIIPFGKPPASAPSGVPDVEVNAGEVEREQVVDVAAEMFV